MSIGVVAGEKADSDATTAVTAIENAGESAVRGTAEAVFESDPSLVVALGESALLDLVRADVSVPVLPIDAGTGVGSVPNARSADALERVLADGWTTRRRRTLAVSLAGERVATALFDAMLVTARPARISEYRIETGSTTVSQFRADGVVVATPQGSQGYAKNLGAPALAPGTDAVVAVPIAPFAIDPDCWVFDVADGVSITVARDEGDVWLFADDREIGRVATDETVELRAGNAIDLVAVDESLPFFDA